MSRSNDSTNPRIEIREGKSVAMESPSYEDLIGNVDRKWRVEFRQFIDHGTASEEFMQYMDNDRACQETVEKVFERELVQLRQAIKEIPANMVLADQLTSTTKTLMESSKEEIDKALEISAQRLSSNLEEQGKFKNAVDSFVRSTRRFWRK
jgi:hypothetical protein